MSETKRASNISIAICAFNAVEYTKLLVDSIRRHSRLQHEILIYSDGSSDGTADWLKAQEDIRWVHNRKNRGICTAMNQAARMATREFLFFPNTDHVLSPGWDEALARWLEPNTVVSFSCIEPGLVPVASIFHAENCGGRFDEFNERRFHDAAARLARHDAVTGINYPFAISTKLWDELGGLDERFNPGPANDPDLFYRLHFAGAKMIRAQDCVIYHFSGKSSRLAEEAQSERREWHLVTQRNEARFEEKWGERYRYANGGLPEPGEKARERWDRLNPIHVRSRLRVGIDTASVTADRQGIGAYTANLIRALTECGEDLEVRAIEPSADIRDMKLDLFHGPAFALPERLTVPSVVTIHDLAFLSRPEWYPPPFVKHLSRVVEKSARGASRIIAVSDFTRSQIERHFPESGRRIVRIYEAVPEELMSAPSAAIEPQGNAHGYILSVGVQQPRKNAAGLVRAYAELKRTTGTCPRLVLVGGAACEDPALASEIRKLGLEDDVALTGHLSLEELKTLYLGSRAVVSASLEEGFGLTVLEALALGKPVVCSDIPAFRELAGDAALFGDPDRPESFAQVLGAVLTEENLRTRLIEQGKKRAAEFSWRQAAKETKAVYLQAASSKPAIDVRIPKQKPRIAIDTRLLGQRHTGTGRYTEEILRALLAHAGEAEYVAVGPERFDSSFLPPGTSLLQHIPAGPETLLNAGWEQFTLPSQLLGCDLFFSPTGLIPVARPCKAIPVVHDLGFEDHPQFYGAALRDHLSRWVKDSCASADRIIAVSEFTRSRLVERYGLSSDRIRVVHHGKPSREFAGGPRDPRLVLCVSSFEPNKNLQVLVRAVADANQVSLVLAGRSGRDLPAVRALVEQLRVQDRVKLVADPEDAAVHELLSRAGAFAFPSLYEGFGMPLVEAMAAGLPIVANRVASCAEVLGDAGILLDDPSPKAWVQALVQVTSKPDIALKLGEASRRRADAFSWSRAASETWGAFVDCLEAR